MLGITGDMERPAPALRSRLPLRGGLRSRCAALAQRGGGGGGGAFPPTAGRLLGELKGAASSSDTAKMHTGAASGACRYAGVQPLRSLVALACCIAALATLCIQPR